MTYVRQNIALKLKFVMQFVSKFNRPKLCQKSSHPSSKVEKSPYRCWILYIQFYNYKRNSVNYHKYITTARV